MEFEWNPEKAESNYQTHNIYFEEAATVFNDLLSVTFPDPDHSIGESRYVIVGVSQFGQVLIVAHTDRGDESLALEKQLVRSGDFMKKEVDNEMNDDLQSEYDFSQLSGGVRGKYVDRYRAGTNLVLLDPDVAQAFSTQESVNEALRLLMKVAKRQLTVNSDR